MQQISSSQRKAVIKLMKKRARDKRFIKNWMLSSSFNLDIKLILKALSERIKIFLPCIVSELQTAYVNRRFIC